MLSNHIAEATWPPVLHFEFHGCNELPIGRRKMVFDHFEALRNEECPVYVDATRSPMTPFKEPGHPAAVGHITTSETSTQHLTGSSKNDPINKRKDLGLLRNVA
ncbi:unnamed protein product, partial [Amoebophrya sp. A25]|eukprot:GSA25T00007002001.1